MAIRIKLDEDLSASVGTPFRDAGFEVATVVQQGWSGLPDDEIWKKLRNSHELLVTADKGFADVRRYPPGSHAGVLLLRPHRESLLEYRSLAAMVAEQGNVDKLVGATAVATPRGVRIRRR